MIGSRGEDDLLVTGYRYVRSMSDSQSSTPAEPAAGTVRARYRRTRLGRRLKRPVFARFAGRGAVGGRGSGKEEEVAVHKPPFTDVADESGRPSGRLDS
jgi:hypothetical protein